MRKMLRGYSSLGALILNIVYQLIIKQLISLQFTLKSTPKNFRVRVLFVMVSTLVVISKMKHRRILDLYNCDYHLNQQN